MQVIVLNGPPGSGKDTLGAILKNMLPGKVLVDKLAAPLKMGAHAVVSLLRGEQQVPGMAAFEGDAKDNPSDWFFGATPRDAYIGLSEDYCKKTFGRDVFVRSLIARAQAAAPDWLIITDGGFQHEVNALEEEYGERLHTVRIVRPGTSFDGDSREPLTAPDFHVQNNGEIFHLYRHCACLVADILDTE